jgi:hypothetical protein
VARTMFLIVAYTVLATAPALAIEWDLKKRARRAARLSKALAKTGDGQ